MQIRRKIKANELRVKTRNLEQYSRHQSIRNGTLSVTQNEAIVSTINYIYYDIPLPVTAVHTVYPFYKE